MGFLMQAREKDNRRDWIIVLVILLIGLWCIMLVGGWALRLSPSWRLDSNMRSNLDPNSDFLTARSLGLVGPVDSSILTQPAWMGLYLTPGASFQTGTPYPTRVKETLPPPATKTSAPTFVSTTTATPRIIIYPTNTSVVINPPTRTPSPAPTVVPTSSSDLSITITDGSLTYTVGGSVTYTIVVRNTAGPSAVTGATVTDNFPAELSGITWTCTGSAGGTCSAANGIGNINNTVNLPIGAFVTFTVNATVSPAATNNLVNAASVNPPATVADPATGNNTATDSDTPIFNMNLSVTKTDGTATYNPGTTTTYTIAVSNAGPANAVGATVADTFSATQVTGVTWTCAATGGAVCPAANGTGNINETVNIPVGGTLTYTATASISAATTTNLLNTASVTQPAGAFDPISGNNLATDTDTPIFNVDLRLTKTDGTVTYTPGTTTTYTIVVTNPTGPADATGATVTDTFPAAQVSGVTWSCVPTGGAACTANGNGNINETVNIPVGGTLTYTAIATILPSATGPLSNTSTITPAGGYNETANGDNSQTDVDTPAISADLVLVLKTDNATAYVAGATKVYSIIVRNDGPSAVAGATVTDTFPWQVASATWNCTGTGGAVCTANGVGNINDPVNMPVGSTVTYTVNATIGVAPTNDLVNTATVTAPFGYTDNTGNNSYTDTDTLITIDPTPGEIGTIPDGTIYNLGAGTALTQAINITVNGHAGWDLVYYERPAGSGILLDWIIIEIGDGENWYTIFNWGDNAADANTNMNFTLLPPPIITPPTIPPEEPDQRDIPTTSLYNSTGIAIDLDSLVPALPAGTYTYIRFTAPAGDTDGHTEIDAIEVLP
jgi:uncharacterized repeat protein (TIGR01451 family)